MGELIVVLRHKKGLMLLALGLTSVGLVGCGNQNTEVVNEQVSIETESVVEESVKVVNEPVSLDIASLVNSEANTDERFIFDTETGTILLYKGTDLNVVIPEELGGVKVRAIGDSAFNSHETTFKITGVTLHSGLEVIGDRAFSINALTVLDLSVCKGLVSIGDHAFIANKLTDLVLPRSVKELGQGAFSNNQLIHVNLGLVEDIG